MHFSRAHQSNLSRCKVVKVYDNVKQKTYFLLWMAHPIFAVQRL